MPSAFAGLMGPMYHGLPPKEDEFGWNAGADIRAAQSRDTSAADLEVLAVHDDPAVRMLVAKNPRASSAVIDQLRIDRDYWVARYARETREHRHRGGLGFLIDRRLPPGKCTLAMRSDGSTTEFCNPDPPKRKKRAKAAKKRTWKFTNGGRASVRTRGRVHYVYRRYPRGKRWVQVFKYRNLGKAQRAAARWGALKGR